MMISSAVVIPEPEPDQHPPSPNLKRRQSSISSDSNKRPRLDTQPSTENVTSSSRSPTAGAMSPPSRRRSTLNTSANEEKKRGQRLFGALLGTLSQTSSKPAHRKRDEIEQRQRDRIRKDTEEREEEQRRKREALDRVRRDEQRAWDREGTRIRHRNMRATARFLLTKTEPRLYYRPWELREDEEDAIKKQAEEVEQRIRAELGEDNDEDVMQEEGKDDRRQSPTKSLDEHREDSEQKTETPSEDPATSNGQHGESNHTEPDVMKVDSPETNGEHTADQKPSEDDRPKEDDHAGEELVEGQEDDVIY